MGKNSRVIYMDLLRIISIIAVVIIHVGSQIQSCISIYSTNWNIYNIFVSSSRFSVPVFVMISGYFFLNPNKEIKIGVLYKKYISRIMIAFLFWSFIYAIATTNSAILAGKPEAILIVLKRTVEGHAQFWYLYMLVGLYMITPFIRRMLSVITKKELEYFLILSFIFTGIVPYLEYFNSTFLQELFLILNKFKISFVTGYTFYFVLGYYIGNYSVSKKIRRISYVLGIIGLFCTIWGTWYFQIKSHQNGEIFQDNVTAFIICYSIAVFLFVKEKFQHFHFSERTASLITKVSQYTFGMYLCHDSFNMLYYKLGIWESPNYPAWVALPVFVLIDVVGSFVVVAVMTRIPFLRKTVL